MAKYNYYAINKGFDSENLKEINNKIYTSWDECKKYIKGVSEARYKGFLTLSEAKEWLKQFDDNKTQNKANTSVKMDNSNGLVINNNISIIDNEFETVCNNIGVNPYDVLKLLKKQFIETHKLMMNIPELPWN